MGFGLSCINGNNELTLSSDGMTFGYVGKATLVSTVQPSSVDGFRSPGYSSYTINWPGEILVAPTITTLNGGTYIVSQTQSGSSWSINVSNSDGTVNSEGFVGQTPTDVYVWGIPVNVSGFGLALYNSLGALSGDLSRPPLTFNNRLFFDTDISSVPFTGITKPAVIGTTRVDNISSFLISPFYGVSTYVGAWKWDSGGGRLIRTKSLIDYSIEGGAINRVTTQLPTIALVIEASGLI